MENIQSYNCRVYDYPKGMHVTFYRQGITKGQPQKEGLTKESSADHVRTLEQERHCNAVSASQSKNRIYNIARSNEWEWFITITFDRQKVRADNYNEVTAKLRTFIEHLQERKCPDLKYLIVPEMHADGQHFHFHGLLANCGEMRFAFSGKYDKGKPIFNMPDWSLGFTTATRVSDSQKASSYICKYITKECAAHLKEKHRYYCSRNCNRTEAEYHQVDEEDFQKLYGDRITYVKTQEIPQAGQIITYYEVKE